MKFRRFKRPPLSTRDRFRQQRLDRIARQRTRAALKPFVGKKRTHEVCVEAHQVACCVAQEVFERYSHLARKAPAFRVSATRAAIHVKVR